MNGVVAVRSLMTGNAALTAVVPESRITAGVLPQGSNLPAIALMSISGIIFMLGMGVFFLRFFKRKMAEDEAAAAKAGR